MIITELYAKPDKMREPNTDMLNEKSNQELIDLKRDAALDTLNNDLTLALDTATTDALSPYLIKYEDYLNSVLSILQLKIYYFQQMDVGATLTDFRYEKYENDYTDAKRLFKNFTTDETSYIDSSTRTYKMFR